MGPYETSREIRLQRYPTGVPTDADFEMATVELPSPADGEVLVKNLWMSVDPYMRGRMSGQNTYVQGFALGRALEGGAVGQVVESRHPTLRAGDYVVNPLGWREGFVSEWPGAAGRRRGPGPRAGLSRRARHAGDVRLCRAASLRGAEAR